MLHRSIPTSERIKFNALWMISHLFGPRNDDTYLFENSLKTLRQRVGENLAKGPKGKIFPIDRVDSISRQEFQEKYQKRSLPVVITGAAKEWVCCKTWSPEMFAERYGDDPVTLLSMSVEEVGGAKFKPIGETVSLRELVKRLRSGEKDFYWRFSPLLHNHPELQKDFDDKWLESFREKRSVMSLFQLFVGAGGTNTALHNAPASNLFVQVYGQKHWLIYPPEYNSVFHPPLRRAPYFFSHLNPEHPDQQNYPGCEHLDGYEVLLNPGDVLYIPPYAWHYVTNPSDSIGVGYRWFAPRAAMSASVTQTLLTALSSNPPVIRNAINARFKKGNPDLVTSVPKAVPPILQG
ncbi:MAG: cupin-like domain-containing protein [Anaerolineae bacterium]|nr:cupin-like domain-containing protein [Gloeobacterales cyanobacterium ES-bin-313]